MKHNLKFTIITSAICFSTNAQAPYWKLGGNPTTIPDAVNTTNNYIGTNVANNTWLRMGVQGSQDILIDNDPAQLLAAAPVTGATQQGGHWLGLGRIFQSSLVNPFFGPKAHLHIHGGNTTNNFGFAGGLRPWFNTGTLYTENSDGMYVGLRNIGTNFSYAVINWSDDAYGGAGGTDFLSFNFTGGPNTESQTVGGQELGRFNPTQGRGTLGIGNFQFIGTSTEPVRRLEILDADPATGSNANSPQLRTTYTYNTTPTNGIFTEFQTTSTGDMYFNTRANTIARRFGFHDNTPGNTVEITANGSSPIPVNVNGTSGLRFTNMVAGNTPQANPGAGVLSVNATGDVILVPDGGVPTANNGVSVNAGVVQLGVPCTLPSGFPNLAGILATQLTTDRLFANRNQNFWIASLDAETGGVGIGGQPVLPFCGTGNTFEVSANAKNTKYGNIDASGVRLTKLLSTSQTIPNGTYGVNSSKVLTVDEDGDVVLTDAFTGSSLGNLCGATQNPLTNNYEIPMAGYNFNYTTPSNTQSSFNIGNAACVPTLGRMNVYNDNLQTAGFFNSNLNSASTSFGVFSNITNSGNGAINAIQGVANSSGVNSVARGLRGQGIAANGNIAQGVFGIASANNNCQQNIAIGGLAANGLLVSLAGDFDVENSNSVFNQGINVEVKLGTNTSAINFGINTGVNTPASVNYGGYFAAAGATNNYGVYGQAPNSGGISGPNYAGYFDGDLVYTGTFGMASDATLKTNIDTLQDAIVIINQLKPKQFNFDKAGHPSMSFPSGLQYGLIAQDVETVLPNLVNNNVHPAKLDTLGNVVVPPVNFKSVEYEQLIPFLIKGIQQQQAQIKKQDSLITALSNQINTCCANTTSRNTNTTIDQLDIELSDKDAIVLNQNVPNPFAEQTTITFNVPASVVKAQLIFYNSNGQVIQTVDIKTRGKGKVNVFAADLSTGLYHYTLVADGKVADSKKMVRE